jgi:hypothetical protein
MPGELTLIVETPAGVLLRRIPSASPLPEGADTGTASEEAVHDAAALWGLPDFTYRGHVIGVGGGTRELGDNLLIVGSLGIVVQVKSRSEPTDDAAREQRWLFKQAAIGLRQARGTVRRLKLQPVELTNARGREVALDANELRWVAVVVLDHPDPPDDVNVPVGDGVPAVVMLRRDWEFLFDQLRSTHAFGAYVERVVDDSVVLGEEPARYFRLAMADQQAEPDEIDPALVGPGGRTVSAPLLPMATAPEDMRSLLLVRSIFEDIALIPVLPEEEAGRLAALAELDRLPVNQRADIGRFLMESLELVVDAGADETLWRMRRFVGGLDKVHLVFAASSQFSDMHKDMFGYWVQLRHYDHLQVRADADDLLTVGVLLTPRHDGVRAFETTMVAVRGALDFSETELQALRAAWPTPAAEETHN